MMIKFFQQFRILHSEYHAKKVKTKFPFSILFPWQTESPLTSHKDKKVSKTDRSLYILPFQNILCWLLRWDREIYFKVNMGICSTRCDGVISEGSKITMNYVVGYIFTSNQETKKY